jgi:mono/diheme cytochrome c family protein
MPLASSFSELARLALDQIGRRGPIYKHAGNVDEETERMLMRLANPAGSLIAGLLLISSAASAAADTGALRKRGKAILEQHCSRCHAIGPVGASPLAGTPPMRDVYARFLPRELQAELSEGMVSRHRAMPQIDFRDEDVDAILAYLYALSIRKSK